MDQQSAPMQTADGTNNASRPAGPSRKRSMSGSAGGLLSRIPFVRSSRSGDSLRPRSRHSSSEDPDSPSVNSAPFPPVPELPSTTNKTDAPTRSISELPPLSSVAILEQQQKTRRRRGSLRKIALLGRGAQRERKESKTALSVDTKISMDLESSPASAPVCSTNTALDSREVDAYGGLGISDITPRPSMDGFASRSARQPSVDVTPTTTTATNGFSSPPDRRGHSQVDGTDSSLTSPTISYSTTDEEDALHMVGPASRPTTPSSSSISLVRPERASLSSGSEGYFPSTLQHTHQRTLGLGGARGAGASLPSIQRRRSATQRAKSPLALTSLTGLSTTPLPPSDTDWDYSETEWWGWVVLIVTWTVFVTGMGSTLGIWSWAWDVGKTPYAPPELEDDPTLPIVGYYPALMILTCVMAWVWVVVAWVGMKYFRHARVSGD